MKKKITNGINDPSESFGLVFVTAAFPNQLRLFSNKLNVIVVSNYNTKT
jgi:hypothetical protein